MKKIEITKKQWIIFAVIAVLVVGVAVGVALSCGTDEENSDATRIYVAADDVLRYVDIDFAAYETPPTLYDILRENDTLEADIDRTTDPDTLLSVCNVRAARGEKFVVYSSNMTDAPEGAPTVEQDGVTMYRIEGDFMSVVLVQSGKYLIRLESVA